MLKRLRLINFRRYPKLEINFDSHLNIIEGENNAGKTTIFMGIEYALFGTVSGFKSQTELATPESDEIGAELMYQGIDGKIYKLQRMHIIGTKGKGKRGASGFYTLKEMEEDGEKYVLSSDFENNPEEMLQLKIFETFGISKRLFNIAINVKQGEISEILLGKQDLDIVLGVSAAKIAEKTVRQIALGFEKETSQFNSLKSSKDALSTEKLQLSRQKSQLDGQISEIEKSVANLTSQKEDTATLKSLINEFQETFDEAFDLGEDWNSRVKAYRDLFKSHKTLIEVPIKELESKKLELQSQIEGFQTTIKNSMEKEDDINSQLRQYNQQLGDINGKLHRRQSLKLNEDATCEVCGSKIDPELVKKEISQWEIDMSQIQAQITVLNAQMTQLRSEMNSSRSKQTQLSNEINQLQLKINQINQSEDQLNSRIPTIQKLESEFLQAIEILNTSQMTYTKGVSEWLEAHDADVNLREDLTIGKWETEEEKTVHYHTLEIKGSTITKFLELNEYNDQLSKIQEAQIRLIAAADAKIQGEKARLVDLQRMASDIEPRIKRLEREIVGLEKEIQKLHRKRSAASKLRSLASAYKQLTTILRNNSATELAKLTWEYHKELSGTDEYRSLSIDPKNYALLIEPKDIDEEVPAYYYQGGGHKLLLGLAYKFAISKLVTKPSYYLLDEPTYGLDNENKQRLLTNIQELAKSVQINLITHQREELKINGNLMRITKEERVSHMEAIS